jgi:hypothetical protein
MQRLFHVCSKPVSVEVRAQISYALKPECPIHSKIEQAYSFRTGSVYICDSQTLSSV